jgi:hypothetical protein
MNPTAEQMGFGSQSVTSDSWGSPFSYGTVPQNFGFTPMTGSDLNYGQYDLVGSPISYDSTMGPSIPESPTASRGSTVSYGNSRLPGNVIQGPLISSPATTSYASPPGNGYSNDYPYWQDDQSGQQGANLTAQQATTAFSQDQGANVGQGAYWGEMHHEEASSEYFGQR